MALSAPDLIVDREYVSQFTLPVFGILIHKDGVVDDPDANTISVTMTNEETEAVVFTRDATREAVGDFRVTLSSAETRDPAKYKLTWSYSLDTVPQVYESYLQVGPVAPAYDALSSDFKLVVEQTWSRFADLFDSPDGGPHLQVYFQTKFNRNRMAQLLGIAVQALNTISQPHHTYTLTDTAPFPVGSWGGLLEQALYVEVVKHLRRSYTEMPQLEGNSGLAFLDRRDYMARWGMVLEDERATLKPMMDSFKIATMGLGRPHVLVSGGVYGDFGPSRLPGSAAARPRYYWAWN